MLIRQAMRTVNWSQWIHRIAFLQFGIATSAWIFYIASADFEHPGIWDWLQFHDTALLLLSGRTHEIYPGITFGAPFFYPPYLVLLVAPLGYLSRVAAYFAILGSQIAAMALALWLTAGLSANRKAGCGTAVLVALSSANWTHTLIAGHLSGFYLLILVLGHWLWVRGRPAFAGAALSLMMIKPNYGLAILPFVLVRRQWSAVAGWACGLVSLVGASLWLGSQIWHDYFVNYRTFSSMMATGFPMWKQQTLYAFWRTALGLPQSSLAFALWAASALPLYALAAALWYRTPRDAEHLPRLFGVLTLAIICCNPYSTPYDGLMLVLPGMAWYLFGETYRSTACILVSGFSILFVYVDTYVNIWLAQGGWALLGPAIAVWLISEVCDLWRVWAGAPRSQLTSRDVENAMATAPG
jgi:hypothetical protein